MYFVQTMLEGVLHDCCEVDHPSGRTLTPSFIPPHEFGSRCRSSGLPLVSRKTARSSMIQFDPLGAQEPVP